MIYSLKWLWTFIFPVLILELWKFFFIYLNDFKLTDGSVSEIWKLIIYSVRFDSIILLLFFFPLIVLGLLSKGYLGRLRLVAASGYTLLILLTSLLSVTDILFYRSNFHHLGIYDVNMLFDNFLLLGSILEKFWYLLLLIVLITLLSFSLFKVCIGNLAVNYILNKNMLALT